MGYQGILYGSEITPSYREFHKGTNWASASTEQALIIYVYRRAGRELVNYYNQCGPPATNLYNIGLGPVGTAKGNSLKADMN